MQVEVPTLIRENLELIRKKINGLFNIEAPLSFNVALSVIIDDEICTVLSNTSYPQSTALKGKTAKKY